MNNRILPLLALAAAASATSSPEGKIYPFRPAPATWFPRSHLMPSRQGGAEFHPRISQRQKRKAARRSGKFPVRK